MRMVVVMVRVRWGAGVGEIGEGGLHGCLVRMRMGGRLVVGVVEGAVLIVEGAVLVVVGAVLVVGKGWSAATR